MAMITYPLNNIEYTAEDAELFHCTRKSGVYATNSFILNASGTNTQISVGKGIAWISNGEFSGKVVAQRETNYVDLGAADSTYPRIDVIAIQYNANDNATKLIVKKGSPSSNPQMPSITRTSSVYELYLCKVLRPAGSAVVKMSEITALRTNENLCGLMADSITSISTKDIDDQIQALINELNDEIEAVKNQTGVLLKSGLYPVGSVFMTGENVNPSSYLGGTWKLVNKQLAYRGFNESTSSISGGSVEPPIFNEIKTEGSLTGGEDGANIDNYSLYGTVEGSLLIFRLILKISDDTLNTGGLLGKLRFNRLGFQELPFTIRPIMAYSDDGNAMFVCELEYNTGKIRITKSIPLGESNTIPQGSSIAICASVPISSGFMSDAYCDKFYWKRTA